MNIRFVRPTIEMKEEANTYQRHTLNAFFELKFEGRVPCV